MSETNSPNGDESIVIDPSDPLYTTGAVARTFGVKPATVRRWIAAGKMKAVRMPGEKGKGQFRVHLSEMKRFGHHTFQANS